jgi:outer membrane protein assembly factor BamD
MGIWSCGGPASQSLLKGADFYYQEGMRDLEKRRYLKAQEKLQRVVSNFPGSPLIADAQFHLGEAYFGLKEYVSAVFEFQRVIDAYGHSRWVARAQFKIGESYYRQMRRAELDQTETYQALAHFRSFIEDNPDSPLVEDAAQRIVECRSRLAKKSYLSARLYHRQGYLEPARLSYEEVVRSFPDTPWYFVAMVELGDIARHQGDIDQARYYWEEVIDQTEDEKLKRRALKLLSGLGTPEGE